MLLGAPRLSWFPPPLPSCTDLSKSRGFVGDPPLSPAPTRWCVHWRQFAKCARSTVAVAIKALEDAGVLTWVNRLVRIRDAERDPFGHIASRWRVIRTSNGYRFRGLHFARDEPQFFGRQQACSSRTLPPRFQMSATPPNFSVIAATTLMFELGGDDFDTPLRRRLTPDLTGQAFARRLLFLVRPHVDMAATVHAQA
jgi:hypothetical protein